MIRHDVGDDADDIDLPVDLVINIHILDPIASKRPRERRSNIIRSVKAGSEHQAIQYD